MRTAALIIAAILFALIALVSAEIAGEVPAERGKWRCVGVVALGFAAFMLEVI